MPNSKDQMHDKSLKTLADNERWLEANKDRTVHTGDLPVSTQAPSPDRPDDPQQQ